MSNETPDQPKRRGRPPGSKNKGRTKGFMAEKRLRDSVKAQPPLSAAPVKQLIAAGSLLRAILREQVEGLDDNAVLRDALALHEAAEQTVAEMVRR